MRHYEIVFLVHPDQSEQVPAMIERYQEIVGSGGGQIHRSEDWGRRRLAYGINDVHKAHYVLFNIECSLEVIAEIKRNFKFNDSILRHLVIRRKNVITEESPFVKAKMEEESLEEEKRLAAEAEAKEKAQAQEALPEKESEETEATAEVAEAVDDAAPEGSEEADDTKTSELPTDVTAENESTHPDTEEKE